MRTTNEPAAILDGAGGSMIIVPTPWYAVPSFADVLAIDGLPVNVGSRHSASEVGAWRGGVFLGFKTVDPNDKVPMYVSDLSDAIVTLATAFPGLEILPSST